LIEVGSATDGEATLNDEFENVAFVACLPMTPTADGNAISFERSAIAKVVSRIHR
jgi:hypothetical protein